MAPSNGRPPIQNPKNQRLALRVTPSEKAEIQNFMRESGYSLLELIQAGMEAEQSAPMMKEKEGW